MNTQSRNIIKFKHGDLEHLRERLLEDLSKEHFAVLLGKTRKIDGCTLINVVDLLFPAQSDYNTQNVAFLRIKKDFIHKALAEVNSRYDADTIIDVHTHPFSQGRIAFSATDDGDEQTFFQFLNETFAGIHYASIVFSQSRYSARIWTLSRGSIIPESVLLKTQTSREHIASADFREYADDQYEKTAVTADGGFFNRRESGIGLGGMRKNMHDQAFSFVGVGGWGSILTQHLFHMRVQQITLIDTH